ncbi:MAG: DMT family transporter [Gammaproteobacteria bacterium]|nr:DMT family transporter [Gammaproteobacteria bacterium]
MPIPLLYVAVVFIWGTTWAAIPYQLGVVAEEWSVAYRFGIASLALFAYARFSRRTISIPWKHYPLIIVMGALLFSVNYLFVYYGTGYLSSGLVAVLFSSIIVFNSLFERIFFARLFVRRLQAAAAVSIAGIVLIFWPEVNHFSFNDDTMLGITWVLLAVVVAALANMTAVINTSRGLSLVVVNAHAMAWGALTSFAVAVFLGRPFNFLMTPEYLLSLLYLAIFGSSIAFGCYLALVQKIGAARAAYSSVLFPIVALVMATFFENYQWTSTGIVGVALTLAGNWLALTRIKSKQIK